MRILGIETSCDETAASVVEAQPDDKSVQILSNVVASSLPLHAKTGGIIPETAARQQIKYILPVIEQALIEAEVYRHSGERSDSRIGFWTSQNDRPDIDAIAVTYGPGLIGSLLVGVETAKTLSYVWQKPLVPVNHLIGHIYANWISPQLSVIGSQLSESGQSVDQFTGQPKTEQQEAENRKQKTDNRIAFPALALIVSGGHTDLVLIKSHGKIKWLGGTRDDAAGEAFDKIGRLLNLPYPGGPEIEKAAKNGNPKAFNFPRPLIGSDDLDFSFSGLKTAVFREVSSIKYQVLSKKKISDLSASIQAAIIDVLVKKTIKAAEKYNVKSILLSGGVAANQALRNRFSLEIRNLKLEISLSVPQKFLCTDNAAMIASAAFFNYKEIPWQKLTASPELYFE